MEVRHQRWRILLFGLLISLIAIAFARLRTRREGQANRKMPTAQFLSVTSRVPRGPEAPSASAPHVSITAPGGGKFGYDRDTGTIQHGLPGTYSRGDRSARSEEDHLIMSDARDGRYVIEVIAAGAGSYDLSVTAGGQSSTELHTSATRRLRGISISEGAVHRYEVTYAHDDDATALPTIVALDAPGPGSSTWTVSEWPARPPQLGITLRNACESGPPSTVRLRTPSGRVASYDRSGATRGDDIPGLSIPPANNGFTVTEPTDGEYVVEISPAETTTSYHLNVSWTTPTVDYGIQPITPNCARTTIAPGQVHRWTVRLARGAEFPIRVIWPDAELRPAPSSR